MTKQEILQLFTNVEKLIAIYCNKQKTNNFKIIFNYSQQMLGELKFALLQKGLVIAKDLKGWHNQREKTLHQIKYAQQTQMFKF